MVKRVAGLEITSDAIRVVELERNGPLITLKNMASVPAPAGAVKDGEIVEVDKVAGAIQRLFESAGIKTKKVVISLSGKGVIIHGVTFPSMSAVELKEVVKSELEKYTLLLTNNFVFDYKPLSQFMDKGYRRIRLFYAGVSQRLLDSYFRCMRKAGLSIVSIDLAPLSVATVQYADLNGSKTVASVLIKDDDTYVTVIDKGRFRLFYGIGIGSVQLFGSQPADAISEKAAGAFISELERLFKFYEIEFGRGKIDKLILSYDNSKYRNMDKIIAPLVNEGMAAETINPLKRITVPEKAAAEKMIKEGIGAYAVAVGAALRGFNIIGHNITLQLLQGYIPRPQELKKTYLSALASLLLVISIAIGTAGYQMVLYNRYNNSLKEKEIKLTALNTRLEGLREVAQRHRYLRELLKRQASYLKVLNRVSWSVLLSKVTGQIPEDVWLKDFEARENNEMSLRGSTYSVEKVAGFIRKIDEEPTFEKVALDSIDEANFTKDTKGVNFKIDTKILTGQEKKDEGAGSEGK